MVHILTHDRESEKKRLLKNVKIFNKGPSITNYLLNIKIITCLKKSLQIRFLHNSWNMEFHTLLARLFLKGRYFVFTHGMLIPILEQSFGKT